MVCAWGVPAPANPRQTPAAAPYAPILPLSQRKKSYYVFHMEFYCGLAWMLRPHGGRGGRSVLSLANLCHQAHAATVTPNPFASRCYCTAERICAANFNLPHLWSASARVLLAYRTLWLTGARLLIYRHVRRRCHALVTGAACWNKGRSLAGECLVTKAWRSAGRTPGGCLLAEQPHLQVAPCSRSLALAVCLAFSLRAHTHTHTHTSRSRHHAVSYLSLLLPLVLPYNAIPHHAPRARSVTRSHAPTPAHTIPCPPYSLCLSPSRTHVPSGAHVFELHGYDFETGVHYLGPC